MTVEPVVAFVVVVLAFVLGVALTLVLRWVRDARSRGTPLSTAAPPDTMASHNTLQGLIDAIPAMINCKDRAGRYVLMNAYQAELYGTTPKLAIGRTSGELLGADYGNYTSELDARVIDTAHPVGPVAEEYADARGRIRSWMTSKSPIMDRHGHVTHVATIAFDVTEHKRIEGLLVRARNEAEAASRAKAAFLATMSHELRTPLNAVIGFSDLMRHATHGPLGSPKYEEYARDVAESGRFLLAIINDILDLSKIEAGQVTLKPEALDVPELLNQCRRLVAPRAEQGRVKIAVKVEPRMSRLHADRRLLVQIVVNLLTNAVKFSPVDSQVEVEAVTTDDAWTELRVVDHGVGMSEEEIEIALRPFEQVDREHARTHEGTGLGLPIVKGLVDLHGGVLEIQSRPGTGTTVTVRLPQLGSSQSSDIDAPVLAKTA